MVERLRIDGVEPLIVRESKVSRSKLSLNATWCALKKRPSNKGNPSSRYIFGLMSVLVVAGKLRQSKDPSPWLRTLVQISKTLQQLHMKRLKAFAWFWDSSASKFKPVASLTRGKMKKIHKKDGSEKWVKQGTINKLLYGSGCGSE